MLRALSAVLVLALASSCNATQIPREWIEADRATFDAVAFEYAAYVQADPGLSPVQVSARLELLQDWNLRIAVGEELVGILEELVKPEPLEFPKPQPLPPAEPAPEPDPEP